MASDPQERPSQWSYPLVEVTEDKRLARPGTPREAAYELSGVDGSIEGGLEPHPGFVPAVKLYSHHSYTGHEPAGGKNSQVTDVFSFQLKYTYDSYVFGFIYRATRHTASSSSSGAPSTADVFIQYWRGGSGDVSYGGLRAITDISPTDPMDVSTIGRLGYIGIQGRSPVRFTADPTTGLISVFGEADAGPFTGPGAQPILRVLADDTSVGTFSDASTSAPGVAQVFPCVTILPATFLGWDTPITSSHSSSSGGDHCASIYPYYAQSGEFFLPGKMRPAGIKPGNVSFAYQLFNSETGLISSLSEVANITEADFPAATGYYYIGMELNYDSSKYDRAIFYRSVRVEAAGGTFVNNILLIDRVVTLSEIHTCRNGTGEDFDPASTDWRNIIYFYELPDGALANQDEYTDNRLFDEKMPPAGVLFNYEGTLFCSKIRNADPSSSTKPSLSDTNRGLGELRWSSTVSPMPELFSAANRYLPKIAGNEIIAIRQAAGNIIGFSLDRQYHIRREAQYVRVEEMHEGYGVSGPRTLDTIGSTIYFLNEKGLKAVDSRGQLDDVRVINNLITSLWSSTELASCSLAFDSAHGCLNILNPARSQIILIWLTTAKVTEIQDAPFTLCFRGFWPSNNPHELPGHTTVFQSGAYPLTERAFFLKNPPATTTGAQSEYPYLFVSDKDHTSIKTSDYETQGIGDRRIRTIHFPGDSFFTVISVNAGAKTVLVSGGSLATNFISGIQAYISTSTTVTEGNSARVIGYAPASGSNLTLYFDTSFTTSGFSSLAAGDTLALSPMFFRWIGAPLGLIADDGTDFGGHDCFRIRQLESINLAFTDVSGYAHSEELPAASFDALAYKGSSDTPSAVGAPRSASTLTRLFSIEEDESRTAGSLASVGSTSIHDAKYGVTGNVVSPGIRIYCPDLTFKLLGARIVGKLLGTYRSRRSRS